MSIKRKLDKHAKQTAIESQDVLTLKAKLKAANDALAQKRAAARERVEATLERIRDSKVKLRLDRMARSSKGGVTLRVIVPDSHGCFVDEHAASAMLADIRMLKPASIILLGDHLDCRWLEDVESGSVN